MKIYPQLCTNYLGTHLALPEVSRVGLLPSDEEQTWLILPVVIHLCRKSSHACLGMSLHTYSENCQCCALEDSCNEISQFRHPLVIGISKGPLNTGPLKTHECISYELHMDTYMHACMHACMHAYIHTNTHTYIHKHILSSLG